MANINQSIIRHQPSSIQFGVYTDDEVRQRSVCEISSSVAYDALQNPLPRGLYDPLLGPTASGSNDSVPCITCGNVPSLCPGHFGHIELCVPVFHPLFFPKLLMFMKIKCLACHEFRVSRRQCKVFVAKLHLIDIGKMNEALDLDRELAVLTQKAGEGKMEGKSNHRQARMETISETATKIDQLLDQKLAMAGDEEHAVLTMHERAARRKVLKDFQTECTKSPKCHNCNAFSPKIRHDQFNKIFQQPLSAKSKKSNLGERVRIRPALANGINGTGQGGYDSEDEVMDDVEDSEDEFHDARSHMIDDEAVEDGADKRKKKKAKKNKDDEEEEIDPTGGGISRKANVSATKTKDDPAKQDKFMHALEVEAQCRLTWEKQPSLCTKFFGSAHSPEGNTSTSTYESSYAQLDTTTNGGGNRPRSTSNAAEQVSGGG
jgi:DNA-directed RNA polymerase I subunit RPA1